MVEIYNLVSELCIKDSKIAYAAMKELEQRSEFNKDVYDFFDEYEKMSNSKNSFIRTRGLVLMSACARWDSGGKLDKVMDSYLEHITDEKPITARQCIQALPNIIKFKPELRNKIKKALESADTSRYKDSMAPLVASDINSVLKLIDM